MKDSHNGYIKVLQTAADKQIQKDEKNMKVELTLWRNQVAKVVFFINLMFLVLTVLLKVHADELYQVEVRFSVSQIRCIAYPYPAQKFPRIRIRRIRCDMQGIR